MLFLLNDVVFRLDGVAMDAQLDGRRMSRLAFPAILRMGQELYAAEPKLQRTGPERGRRLAALMSAKAPMINAALFVAPSLRCLPEEVTVRFLNCQFEVMAELYTLQQNGRLDAISADRRIWQRLAA
ncbi:hypothetical protein [Phenylobacterium sp.]|uniref:hypothetical protein n=1 Tax=Phenylobacterium sp. TaxID=1871053 RepID=UPI0035691317